MPYVIDGSNLGGVVGGRSGARDRHRVVELLLPWTRGRGRVVLVFDGPEEPELGTGYGGLQLQYSGGASADSLIVRLVRGEPGQWYVVTDDRRLADRCHRAGAVVMGVATLLGKLPELDSTRAPGDVEPSVDVVDWQAWFERGASGRDDG